MNLDTSTQDLIFYTFPKNAEQLKEFFKHYELLNLVITPDTPGEKLKLPENRICRFCGLKDSPKLFRSVSHLIPEMLSNHHLYSEFECDNCNTIFSRYESDLAYSLGIYRTLFSVKGKKGIPTFDAAAKQLRAKREDFLGTDSLTITRDVEGMSILNVNKETGECEVRFKKNGYIPINVYKILFKIALSILPEDQAKLYQRAYQFILNPTTGNWADGLCKIMYMELPFTSIFPRPVCYLYNKKTSSSLLPTHYFALYFQHMVYQFPLHFNDEDIKSGLYQAGKIDIPVCPPIIYHIPSEEECWIEHKDLSSKEKIQEEQIIFYKVDPAVLDQLWSMDPRTGEMKQAELKPDEIVKMIFYGAGQELDFSKLRAKNTDSTNLTIE